MKFKSCLVGLLFGLVVINFSAQAVVDELGGSTFVNCTMAVCFDLTGEEAAPVYMNSEPSKVGLCNQNLNSGEVQWFPIDVVVQNPTLALDYFRNFFS